MSYIDTICKHATMDWLLRYLWFEASSILIYQTESVILSPEEREAKLAETRAVLQEIANRLEVPRSLFPPSIQASEQ